MALSAAATRPATTSRPVRAAAAKGRREVMGRLLVRGPACSGRLQTDRSARPGCVAPAPVRNSVYPLLAGPRRLRSSLAHDDGFDPSGRGRPRNPRPGLRPAGARGSGLRGLPRRRSLLASLGGPATGPGGAGPDDAGRGRPVGLPPHPGRGPGADRLGARRTHGPDRGAGGRGRRLCRQAVRAARAGRPHQGPAASPRPGRPPAAGPPSRLWRLAPGPRLPRPDRCGWPGGGADRRGVRPAGRLRQASAAGPVSRRHHGRAEGPPGRRLRPLHRHPGLAPAPPAGRPSPRIPADPHGAQRRLSVHRRRRGPVVRRLGLANRLTLTLVLVVVALQAVSVLGLMRFKRGDQDEWRLPVPGRIAAAAAALDRTPSQERDDLLVALNGDATRFFIADGVPAGYRAHGGPLPALLRSYDAALGARDVRLLVPEERRR